MLQSTIGFMAPALEQDSFELLPSGQNREIGMAAQRKTAPTHDAPCRGLRVLDFGQGIASPCCAMLLDAGCDRGAIDNRISAGVVCTTPG
jgi:hypothetical protein